LGTPLVVTLNSAFLTSEIAKDKFTVRLTNKADAKIFKDVNVYGVTTTPTKTLKIMFNGATKGSYRMTVHHSVIGEIKTSALPDFVVNSELTDFTPKIGSIYGGTLVTITGTNFGTVRTDNPVQINFGSSAIDCFV